MNRDEIRREQREAIRLKAEACADEIQRVTQALLAGQRVTLHLPAQSSVGYVPVERERAPMSAMRYGPLPGGEYLVFRLWRDDPQCRDWGVIDPQGRELRMHCTAAQWDALMAALGLARHPVFQQRAGREQHQ